MMREEMMRRTLFVLVGVAVMVLGLALPAAADRPVEITNTTTFVDLNPCDAPNTHEVTIEFNIKVHEHRNNTVLVIDSAASTDDGFVGNGHETTVFTDGNTVSTFNFVQSNPDTGEKFTVKGNIKIVQDDVKVDNFTFNCVRDL